MPALKGRHPPVSRHAPRGAKHPFAAFLLLSLLLSPPLLLPLLQAAGAAGAAGAAPALEAESVAPPLAADAQQEAHPSTPMRFLLRHASEIAGFRLKRIVLRTGDDVLRDHPGEARQRLQRAPLLAALALRVDMPLPLIDLGAARNRLESLEWVASASLRRIYPDTIEAHIQAQRPFALWQRGGHLFLVNRTAHAFLNLGAVPPADGAGANAAAPFAHLPRLVGAGALDQGTALLEALDALPFLRDNLRAATWVGGRRWDLHLGGDMRVLLPQGSIHPALARLQRLHERYDIFNRDIRVMDLRLADRIAFRLGENAVMPVAGEAPGAPLVVRMRAAAARGDG